MGKIVKISDMTDKEKEQWQEQLNNRYQQRQEEQQRANSLFNNLIARQQKQKETANVVLNNSRKSVISESGNTIGYKLPTNAVKQANALNEQLVNTGANIVKSIVDKNSNINKKISSSLPTKETIEQNTASRTQVNNELANTIKKYNENKSKEKSSNILIPTNKATEKVNLLGIRLDEQGKERQTNKVANPLYSVVKNTLVGASSVIPQIATYGNAINKSQYNYLVNKGLADYNENNIVNQREKALQNSEMLRNEEIQKNINSLMNNDVIGKKVTEMAPSIGQNLVNMAVSSVNPVLGSVSFMTSAAGGYLTDAKQRGMTDDQALGYATIMGLLEGGSESIISGQMLSNSLKAITGQGISQKVLQSYLGNVGENFLQEAVMEPLQEMTAEAIGGKDAANWDGVWKRALQSGIDGILSAILLSGASLGIAGAQTLVNKISNNEQISQTELKSTIQKITSDERVNTREIIQGATQGILEQSKTNETVLPTQQQNVAQNQATIQKQTTRSTAEKYVNNFESKETMNKIVNQLEKIAEIRNKSESKGKLNILFDNSVNGNGLIEIDNKGNRTIKLNPNSKKVVEFTLIHELSHDLKGTEGYSKLVDLVKQYNDGNVNYNDAYNNLKAIYENHYKNNNLDLSKLDINEEAVNDILGTALGTQEFVNRITQEDRGFAQKILDKVKRLINILKSDNRELTKWLYQVQDNFENALKQKNNLQEGIKKSIQYHDVVNINDRIIDRTTGKEYKINEDVAPYIAVDEEKLKYIPYTQLAEFYDNDVDTMDTIANMCSEEATKQFTNGEKSGKILYEGKEYNFRITNDNEFLIDKINTPKTLSVEVADERDINKNSRYSLSNEGYKQGQSNNDNRQIGYDRTSKQISNMDTTKQRQRNELYEIDRKSRNNLENSNKSSFPMDIRYSVSNPTIDNEGRVLSEETQKYFKNSKARTNEDLNNNLVTVYHTTTDKTYQFNEFNPVGTNYYRFGNQIVNYYTDSKEMSGSYANQAYKKVDTTKLNTFEEAKKYVENYQGTYYIEGDFKYELEKDGDNYNLVTYELKDRGFNTNKDEYSRISTNNLGTDFQKVLKELKGNLDFISKTRNNYQYEGYVNLENPYILDAEGRNWNEISYKIDERQQNAINKVKDNPKTVHDLESLAKQSYEKYDEYMASENPEILQKYGWDMLPHITDSDLGREIQDCELLDMAYDNSFDKSLPKGTEKIGDYMDIAYKELENMTISEYVDILRKASREQRLYGSKNSWFNNNLNKLLNNSDIDRVTYSRLKELSNAQLFRISYNGFNDKIIKTTLEEAQTTNDIVKQVIEMNKNGSNYDGLIIKNTTDYGGTAPSEYPANLYVTFNSNQFKAYDNTNPTTDNDIRYSQTKNGNWDVYLNELDSKLASISERNKTYYLPTKNSTQSSINLPKNQAKTIQEVGAPIPNTPGQEINWNEIERPEGKFRKHYKSIIESSNTTDQAKKIAREVMGQDTYIPDSNIKQLQQADERISNSGSDEELKSLLSKTLNNEKITAVDVAVGERLIEYYSKIGNAQKLQDAIQTTAMMGTELGQAVQAFSILNHQTPQGQVVWIQRSIDKMNNELRSKRGENAQQFKLTDEMAQKILNSENQQQMQENLDIVYQELGQQVNKTLIEQLDSWRYFSMLGNARTHIRNMTGNFLMGIAQDTKNKIAGAIEGTIAKFNPEMERTQTIKAPSQEVKEFAKNDLNNVQLDSGNKYNPKNMLEQNMRTFKSDAMENTLGKMFKWNDSLLEAEDGLGLKAGYVKALASYITANNLDINNMSDKQLAKARKYAIQQAQERTFHQANVIASAINSFTRKNKVTKAIGDALIPFVKTPANVAKTGIEYSPAGLAKSIVYDTVNLRKGNITINQYIDNLSKGLTGSAITMLGYALAQAGILKASGDDDEKKEKFDEQSGKQAYSLKIGDKTYSIDWLAPVGIPLMVGAEIYEGLTGKKEENTATSTEDEEALNKFLDRAEVLTNSLTTTLDPMVEMSMISGLVSSIRSFSQGDTQALANMMTNMAKSYVNQYVPTLLGQVAKTTDTVERDTTSTKTGALPKAVDSTINQIKSKIPGLRQTLPVRTDIWGEEEKLNNNWAMRFFEAGILPMTIKSVKNNTVVNELNNLYDATGESKILPATIDKTITINGSKYRLTNEEYNKYKKDYGQKAYELINKVVTSSDYKKMTEEQKVSALDKIYTYVKEQNKIDYAKKNNINYEETTLSNTINEISKSKGNISEYISYVGKTQGVNNQKDKISVLADGNYTDKTKQLIYENSIGKDDELYSAIKGSGIDITSYLKYKTQDFMSDKVDDGTTTGKSVSGSKKTKVVNYINKMDITNNQKLLLLGTQYSLTTSEKTTLANYVNSLKLTRDEKMAIYEKLKGFTIYKNGRVTW